MKQVTKQEAVLVFENADFKQDEAVTTSPFVEDQIPGKSEKVG